MPPKRPEAAPAARGVLCADPFLSESQEIPTRPVICLSRSEVVFSVFLFPPPPHLSNSRQHECDHSSDHSRHRANRDSGNRSETGHHDVAARQRVQVVPEDQHLSIMKG